MVRLIIPLMAGILLAAKAIPGQIIPLTYLAALYLFTVFLLLYGYRFVSYKNRWVIGCVLQLLFIVVGFQMTALHDRSKSGSHFRNAGIKSGTMVARVVEPIVVKEKSIRTTLSCQYLMDSGEFSRRNGRLLVYFKKDSLAGRLKYGDMIILEPVWNEIEGPRQPGDFDFKKYMWYRGVYDRAYLASGKWEKLDEIRGSFLLNYAYSLQKVILNVLERHGLEGEEFKVASAILAGYRSSLDPELQQAFSGAGAMHILCVSGLHVGIVYLVFSFLFSILGKKRMPKIIRSVILLLLIWMYALVTGCAPSVMRASTMISFLILGRLLNMSSNVYNTLAGSAFLLLLIDPFMVMAIGFQLSYLAVLGIVTIQPFIYKSVYVKFWLPDKVWAIITVSIAAQAGTFPLAIYYFNIFPNYFLLTNLIVIPAASMIIYLGFLLLISSSLPMLAGVFSYLLGNSIYIMNSCIHWINRIPGAVSEGLMINFLECFLLYLIISFTIIFIGYKKKRIIWIILSLMITFLLSISMN